jgi:hypothetical protein
VSLLDDLEAVAAVEVDVRLLARFQVADRVRMVDSPAVLGEYLAADSSP